jgi:hypothetical protein
LCNPRKKRAHDHPHTKPAGSLRKGETLKGKAGADKFSNFFDVEPFCNNGTERSPLLNLHLRLFARNATNTDTVQDI